MTPPHRVCIFRRTLFWQRIGSAPWAGNQNGVETASFSGLRPPASRLARREPWCRRRLLFLWGRGCTAKPSRRFPGKAGPPSCLRGAVSAVAFQDGLGSLGPLSPREPPGFSRRLCFWDGSRCAAVAGVRACWCPWSWNPPHSRHSGTWQARLACCYDIGD